ncbi:MAG: glycosyltransferase family 2 protein [Mycobacteriales bacterium]
MALAEVRQRRTSTSTVSVVIPARNEDQNIGWVLERLPDCVDEVILVDGQSTDRTVAVSRRLRPDLVVIDEPRPGKGAALRAGFEAATGDVVVMIDADGSMDPREIDLFVAAVELGHDVVKGSRFAAGGGSTDLTWVRGIGNRCLLRLVNGMFGSRFSELCYGYFAFRRDALDRLDLQADGFEIETEIVLRSIATGLRVAEIPSMEFDRLNGQSNLSPVRDGLRVLRTVLSSRFQRRPAAPGPQIDLTDRARRSIDLSVSEA